MGCYGLGLVGRVILVFCFTVFVTLLGRVIHPVSTSRHMCPSVDRGSSVSGSPEGTNTPGVRAWARWAKDPPAKDAASEPLPAGAG